MNNQHDHFIIFAKLKNVIQIMKYCGKIMKFVVKLLLTNYHETIVLVQATYAIASFLT